MTAAGGATPAPSSHFHPRDLIMLARSEMAEFSAFRDANPSLRIMTGGPYLIVKRAIDASEHETPAHGASAVAHACGLAAEVLAGFLDRRPEFRDLDCSALRNVVVNLLSISAFRLAL